jgi:hypothetical protein
MDEDSFKRFEQVSKELWAYTISKACVLALTASNVATTACYQNMKPTMCFGDEAGMMDRADVMTFIG